MRKNFISIFLLLLSCLMTDCDISDLSWDLPKIAVVETLIPQEILAVSANCSGIITEVGGYKITERGFCFNTVSNPTIESNKVISENELVTFNAQIEGLIANTTYYVRAYVITKAGITYGNEVVFTTPSLAKLTTNTVSSITLTTAICGGNITSTGGLPVSQRGICFNVAQNPTTSNFKVLAGSGIGGFTVNLSGLTPNITYYVRAFAINSAGTAYGNEVIFKTSSLPILTTINANSITSTTAQSGGEIINIGSSNIIQKGICYSTVSNPTISNNIVASGSGSGSFTTAISGLISGTTYYLRAYATNSSGTGYGNEIIFTTAQISLPTVNTVTASSITINSAISGGDVSNDGGVSVTSKGICYGTNTNPTISNSKVTGGSGIGSFIATISGLASGTTYYVRAYATNSKGTAYGNEISFTTTQIVLPTVSTATASSITINSAISGGNVSNDGGAAVTTKGICYSSTSNPTISNSKVTGGSGPGSFSATISGLTSGLTYYVRAYATNSKGTAYGNEISFTTTQIVLPTVSTTTVSSVTINSAISGGSVSNEGGAAVTTKGICYSTTSNPTISNSKVTGGSGPGSFTATLSGLSSGTYYYVRAYATNSKGTAYGNEISFRTSTPVILPTVITTTITSFSAHSAVLGGNVTNDGGGTITERGICYSTMSNPTVSNNKIAYGSNLGSFEATLTGLNSGTTYYVRAYAVNGSGTAYGNEISFTTNFTLKVGQAYQGGFIFYLDNTELHGLIAAETDITNAASWGCYNSNLSNCNGTAVGTGLANTTAIITGCSATGTAARLCYDLILNEYSDWFLPSKDELNLMYINLKLKNVGNFTNAIYWSSTQYSGTSSWIQSFSTSDIIYTSKNSVWLVRAVRAF